MVKFRTEYDSFPRRIKKVKNKPKILIVLCELLNIIFDRIFPFALGFYFLYYQNWWLLIVFIFYLFISPHFSVDKDSIIKIKITRGL